MKNYKPRFPGLHYLVYLSMIFIIAGTGCSQKQKDTDIKTMIGTSAKSQISFTGVNYTVNKGEVTLKGNCPSDKDRSEVEKTVKGIPGVKSVINNVHIAPVVMTTDHPMKQSLDSILMKYATVEGYVEDSTISLEGKMKNKDLPKLMSAMESLHAKEIKNRLSTE